MKKSRFTEEQIIRILQEAEAGAKPEEVWQCPEMGQSSPDSGELF